MYVQTEEIAQAFTPTDLMLTSEVVAVTGGLGFVGRHLVRALCRLGKRVIVVDVADRGHEEVPDAHVVLADLRDYDAVHATLNEAEIIFHIAGNASGTTSVERPRFDFETNALGTCNVANAAADHGARRLVYLSSAIVYGTPETAPIVEEHPTRPFLPYGASKLSGELVVRSLNATLGLSSVIGRAFVLYGPGEDPRRAGGEVSQFLRWQLNETEIPVIGDVDRKTRDFLHVADLAHALMIIADRGPAGETYNVGSGTELSMRQLAEAVARATGRPATLAADPTVLEDSFRLVADISRLRQLGFRPQVSIDAGLRRLARLLGSRPELPTSTAVFRRDPGEALPPAAAPAEQEVDPC